MNTQWIKSHNVRLGDRLVIDRHGRVATVMALELTYDATVRITHHWDVDGVPYIDITTVGVDELVETLAPMAVA